MYIWQANNINNGAYELTFAHLEWLKSHNTKHVKQGWKELLTTAMHDTSQSNIRLLDSLEHLHQD